MADNRKRAKYLQEFLAKMGEDNVSRIDRLEEQFREAGNEGLLVGTDLVIALKALFSMRQQEQLMSVYKKGFSDNLRALSEISKKITEHSKP